MAEEEVIKKEIGKGTKKTIRLLKEQLEQKDEKIMEQGKKIGELTDLVKRTQADFINYKARTEKNASDFQKFANMELITNLLPLVDSFELALKNTGNEKDFIEGMELIYAQFMEILKKEGLSPIEAHGKRFDPNKHEVLMKEQAGEEEDTILEEFQKGYMLQGKVIRSSKVKVSKGPGS